MRRLMRTVSLVILASTLACGSVKLVASFDAILLTWAPGVQPSGVSINGYNVVRSINGGTYAQLATVGTIASYKDMQVSNGSSYCYKVQALSAGGASPLSAPVCLRFMKNKQ